MTADALDLADVLLSDWDLSTAGLDDLPTVPPPVPELEPDRG